MAHTPDSFVEQQLRLLQTVGFQDEIDLLNRSAQTNRPEFHIVIVGEFSRGKSTLLNALAGKEVFAASAIPVETVNVLRVGKTSNAVVQSEQGTLTLDVDKLPAAHRPRLVEVTLSLEGYPPTFVFTEYPSMSETLAKKDGEALAFKRLIADADLVIVVLACDSLYSNTERRIVEEVIKQAGHTEILFVCNFIDRLSASNQTDIRQNAIQRLPVGPTSIFFTSALNAVESGTDEGVEVLRQRLAAFSADEQRRIRQQRLAAVLNLNTARLREHIDAQTVLFTEQSAQYNEQLQQLSKEINNLKEIGHQISEDLESFRQQSRQVAETKVSTFVYELGNKIERWLSDQHEDVSIGQHLEQEVETLRTELVKFLQERLVNQRQGLQNSLERYQIQLDEIRKQIPEWNLDPNFDFSSDINPTISVRFDTPQNMATPAQNVSITDVPEAAILILGTIVISIVLPFSTMLLATGGIVLSSIYIYNRRNAIRTQRGHDAARGYTNDLIKQRDAVSLQVGRQLDVYFAQVQDQVKQRVAEITAKTEATVRQYLTTQRPSNDVSELKQKVYDLASALSHR